MIRVPTFLRDSPGPIGLGSSGRPPALPSDNTLRTAFSPTLPYGSGPGLLALSISPFYESIREQLLVNLTEIFLTLFQLLCS